MTFSKLARLAFFGLFFWLQKAEGQVVRGQIFEAETRRPLVGATVFLSEKGQLEAASAQADSLGFFVLKASKSGLFQLKVSQIGFETAFFPEFELEAGKEKSLVVSLRSVAASLPEVEIRPAGNFEKLPSGQHLLSRDAVLKQPAVFADPARLASAIAGVAQPDDGTNGLSLRGLPPTMTRWQIEGLAVVSPNHLGNAGTVSDRPTTNSGGVTMLSAQMLENSSLLVGPQPARFGGATGGILDLRLRPGNDRRREATFSAGLIGLDAAVEGPFSMKKTEPKRASFLANYRYSTVGLLQKLGVSFGDEAIDFQDFSLHLAFPNKNGRGETRLFSILGGSRNQFKNEKDSSAWVVEKDFFEIDFRSKTAVVGLVHDVRLDWWRLSFLKGITAHFATAWSGQTNSRRQTPRVEGLFPVFDTSALQRLDLQFWLTKKISSRTTFSGGGGTEAMWTNDKFINGGLLTIFQPRETIWAEFSMRLTERAIWRIGAKQSFFQLYLKGRGTRFFNQKNNRASFEPSISITDKIANNQQVTIGYARQSMLFPFYFDAFDFIKDSPLLLFQHAFSVRYDLRMTEKGLFATELFYQKLPRLNSVGTQKNILDHIDWISIFEYKSQKTGSATTKGIELTFQKFLEKGFFLLANATFFDAKRQTLTDGEQPMRFNSKWISNLSFGKEWSKTKSENRSRSLGANLRATARGGFWDAPYGILTGEKLPDYWRIDARFYWKKNLKRRTGTLVLDIQNVTNRKNVNYRFYDSVQAKTLTKYGLGLIPILSYRLDFGLGAG